MLRSHLRTAARALRRRPGITAIHIVGLALGLAACLLIGLYVQDEFAYDRLYPDADRIVALGTTDDDGARSAMGPPPLAAALTREAPGVEAATTTLAARDALVGRPNAPRQRVETVYAADADFFAVFGLPLRQGDPATALRGAGRAVVTASLAARLFGDADPMGQTVIVHDPAPRTLTVTGVAEDVPAHASVDFDLLYAFDGSWVAQGQAGNWRLPVARTYARLKPGTDAAALRPTLDALAARHADAAAGFFALPMTDLHLSDVTDAEGFAGSRGYLALFLAVGLLTLVMACINYTNLATAQAATRAREVGVRKSLGADRAQIARQFLGEAVLTALAALPVAALLAALALPVFGAGVGKDLALTDLGPRHALLALAATVGVGLLAGGYPALALARPRPAHVLAQAGRTRSGGGLGTGLRRGLVVTQFAAAVVLVIGTGVVVEQLRYVQTRDLGFEADHVLYASLPDDAMRRQIGALEHAFRQHPHVEHVTGLNGPPLAFGAALHGALDPARPDTAFTFRFLTADADLVETLGLTLVAGRAFDADRPSDRLHVMLNETAVQALGWRGDAVGRTLDWNGPRTVVGVVDDFHFESLHAPVAPLVIGQRQIDRAGPPLYNTVAVRLAGDDVPATLDFLEAQWSRFAPQVPFEPVFLSRRVEQFYRTDRRLGQVLGSFAALAVGIACLGLVGLATFTAQRRTKEISIRKVLGATTRQVVALLSKDIVRLVAVAFVVGAPVGYVIMRRWLESFAYRTDVRPALILAAGAGVLALALLSVAAQTLRAAWTDPASTLRTE